MARGSRHKNDLAIMEARQQRVSRLYREGYSQYQIAEKERVTQATISNDLKKIRAKWVSAAVIDFDEKKAEELAKIDYLESVAWVAWWRSCEDAETVHKKTEMGLRKPPSVKEKDVGGNGKREMKVAEAPAVLVPVKVIDELKRMGQSGNESFLGRVAWCIEMRLKLIGALDKEAKESGPTVININWDSLHERPKETPADIIEGKIAAAKNLPLTNGEAGGTNP